MTYTTTSMSLAAYLVLKKYKLNTKKTEGKMVNFNFPDSGELRNAIDSFHQNADVPVLDYFDSLKRLKSIIHEIAN